VSNVNHPFAATNEPGTCLWCGRKLRMSYFTEKQRTDKPRPPSSCHYCNSGEGFTHVEDTVYECKKCGTESHGGYVYKITKREAIHDKPGPKGDGFFCTLPCAYAFAVSLADHGRRLEPPREK
jgi:ribosomal protein L37AE/L43A